MEKNKNETEEKRVLKYGHIIGAGFGFIVAGILANFLLGMFENVPMSPDPQISSVFITIGILVVLVGLSAEIFISFKEN